MKKFSIPLVLCLLFSLIILSGCSNTTNYSDENNWLTRKDNGKEVDVFFVYPTSYLGSEKDSPMVCESDDLIMRAGALDSSYKDASVFEKVGNIYIPYYRQASGSQVLKLPLEEQSKIISGIPLEDVVAAFDYYIKNHNNGKPFILAGHSQGSNILLFLLSDYMKKHPEVYENMVAAYLIGYSVTDEYLEQNPHLKFAEGATDTGVIISYNTESPKITGTNPVVLENANCINPITWTREETTATKEESLGSAKMNVLEIEKTPHMADATVDTKKGVIICSTVDPQKYYSAILASMGMDLGVLHSEDYPFYYYNIEQNAIDRVQAFLK